jgi:tetratricopeptide (TPR) repeat protein
MMIRSRIFALAAGVAVAATTLCAQSANPVPPKPKSKKEAETVNAVIKAQAQGPDALIAAATDFLTRYADTELKGWAFYVMANAADEKRDLINVVVYGEQSIAADPMNFGSMALMSRAIALGTKKFDLDKAEKLARVQKLAADAIELSKKNPPKPNAQVTDEQWASAVSDMVSPAYEGLAYAAMVDEKYGECAANLKLSLDSAPHPDPALMVRLGFCYRLAKKYDEAVAILDKAIADPNSSDRIKQAAIQQKKFVDQSRAAGK